MFCAANTAIERILALRNIARLVTPKFLPIVEDPSNWECRLDSLAPEPELEPTKLAFGGPFFCAN